MSSLRYAGKRSAANPDVAITLDLESRLGELVTTQYVDDRVTTLSAPLADRSYVDNQDATFTTTAYYQQQDALLIPSAQRGAANGVASLDASSKIAVAQMPLLGDTTMVGPYKPGSLFDVSSVASTPAKIASWSIAAPTYAHFPLVFMSLLINHDSSAANHVGKAVVEVCKGTAYSTSTVVAKGQTATWNGWAPLSVYPAVYTTTSVPVSYSTGTALELTAWLFSPFSDNLMSTVSGWTKGAAFVVKT